MLATCICLNGSLLDQLSCTIVYLHNLFTCTFGRINMSVCLSISSVSQDIPLRKPCCLFVIMLCLLRWSHIFDTMIC